MFKKELYYIIFVNKLILFELIAYDTISAILGFHSMMNQDQYHASLLNKGQPVGLGWDGITKATKQKIFPMEPPNPNDPDETIQKIEDDEPKYIDLNWNNIKVRKIFHHYLSLFYVLSSVVTS